jgi:hypothetical protein
MKDMTRSHRASRSSPLVIAAAIASSLSFGALGCAESVALEGPVGVAHRAPPADAQRPETDIFAEQFTDRDPRALSEFRAVLDRYGTWSEDSTLGTVWTPSPTEVDGDFVPYVTGGHWTYGQDEYVWVADQPWGWVAFHYGRWMFTQDRGWAWIPGRRYAGAWVVWRTGPDGYVGWGPAPAGWYWRSGEAVRLLEPTMAGFVYAKTTDLFSSNLRPRLLTPPRLLDVASRTRPYAAPDAEIAAHLLAPTAAAPTPHDLGIATSAVTTTPRGDAGLQRAWLLAKPSSAGAGGSRPELVHPRLREWVAGSTRYVRTE